MNGPLLPNEYPTEPYEDATPLLQDPDALRKRANELGFLFFSDLADLDLVAKVRTYVRNQSVGYGWVKKGKGNPPRLLAKKGARLTGRGWDDPNWTEFQLNIVNHPDFWTLISNERLLSALDLVAGQPMAPATAHHCWLKLPGSPEHTTRPHQDTFYLPDCPLMWTVWIPLTDTPLDVGPLGVIPGSHSRDWEHIDAMTGIDVPKDVAWVTGEAKPGDIVMFGARTVHCAWSNMSSKLVRLSLDVRYEPKDLKGGSILRPT